MRTVLANDRGSQKSSVFRYWSARGLVVKKGSLGRLSLAPIWICARLRGVASTLFWGEARDGVGSRPWWLLGVFVAGCSLNLVDK